MVNNTKSKNRPKFKSRPKFESRNVKRARYLRNNATDAEKKLWARLSRSQLGGHKFNRQIQIGPFFADFVCRRRKLVIELDGWSHDDRAKYDRVRNVFMENEGYIVLRFANEDIDDNLDGVLMTIKETLDQVPTPDPSRKREGR